MSRTIGSLFSGIGGLELGLERAGLGPVLWQVECDPFCREVLAAHWPQATRHEDVRSVGAATLAPVDVLCGGFPCQDASLAGKGAGLLAGERTGLWREFARLVRELRPRYVVAENVPGLIRRGLDVVVADLTAAGYAVEAARIAAADLGAPHRRERVFIVAHAIGAGLRNESGWGSGPRRSDSPEPEHHGESLADTDSAGQQRSGQAEPEGRHDDPDAVGSGEGAELSDSGRAAIRIPEKCELERPCNDFGCGEVLWPPYPDDVHAWGQVPADTQPSICRLADGVSARLARRRAKLKALGNAVVPACAEIAGARVMEIESRQEAA
jgi:DNA (cytosine-5)-methyltransferase 1